MNADIIQIFIDVAEPAFGIALTFAFGTKIMVSFLNARFGGKLKF